MLTISEAAKRVGRSERTIYAWIEDAHLRRYDVVRDGRFVAVVAEGRLLEVDRLMRSRRGRPRKTPDQKVDISSNKDLHPVQRGAKL